MLIHIEELKESKRGIEIIGWVATPQCDTPLMPDIPARASIEERTALLAPYYALLKEVNTRFEDEKTRFLHLHLGHASLMQAGKKEGE
jgi:hypothetical protein